MNSKHQVRADREGVTHAFVRYGVVTFGWTWTLWWTAALAAPALPSLVVTLLFVLGGLGPLLGAAAVLRSADRAYRQDLVRRVLDPRKISISWWLALAAVTILPALSGFIAASVSGHMPVSDGAVTFGTVTFVVGFALAAGLVEEPGWRGVALDRLQSLTVPVAAALMIGVQWILWHLPLFFMEGSYQYELGLGSTRFWVFNAFLLVLSVLYVWLCNGSGGSILVAILAHAGTNIAGSLIPQNTLSDVVGLGTAVVAAAAIIWITRGNLSLERTIRPGTSRHDVT
jgi:uncharacterized protein